MLRRILPIRVGLGRWCIVVSTFLFRDHRRRRNPLHRGEFGVWRERRYLLMIWGVLRRQDGCEIVEVGWLELEVVDLGGSRILRCNLNVVRVRGGLVES